MNLKAKSYSNQKSKAKFGISIFNDSKPGGIGGTASKL
jgi:hypothetical protein